MTKQLYHYLMFDDPAGQQNSWDFCGEMLAAHGITRPPWLFHDKMFPPGPNGDHPSDQPLDEDKFRYELTTGDTIPEGSRVFFNLEGASKRIFIGPAEGAPHPYTPHHSAISFRIEMMRIAHDERPDCKFGYYAEPFWCNDYDSLLSPSPQIQQWLRELAIASYPLAKQCDFYLPNFYDHSVRPQHPTLEDRVEWIRRGLDQWRLLPDKPIIPVVWMEDLDLWRARPQPDTPEAQEARLMSGYKWLKILGTILQHPKVTGAVLWGGGAPREEHNPWRPEAEWWLATLDLLKTANDTGE